MNEAIRPLYEACLACIETLIELDPQADTPMGRLVLSLAAAVQEFEKAEFPLLDTVREELGKPLVYEPHDYQATGDE